MIGLLLLLSAAQPLPTDRPAAKFVPAAGATARATASVRIFGAARFGPGRSEEAPGADRRKAQIIDQQGQPKPAILLEFQ
jgi:hypothetical protein